MWATILGLSIVPFLVTQAVMLVLPLFQSRSER
jgi:hypothetical protein